MIGSVAQWSMSQCSVQMVHAGLSADLFNFCILFFLSFFFLISFLLACFSLFLPLALYSFTTFCDKNEFLVLLCILVA